MSTDTQYILKEHLEGLWTAMGHSIEMTPGRYAPSTSDESYAIYLVVPNRDYVQPHIHEDNMQIRIFHTSYDTLSKLINAALDDLNYENPQVVWNPNNSQVSGGAVPQVERTIFTKFNDEDFKLQEISCRGTGIDQNEFIEGTEHFFGALDILYRYVSI